MASFRILHLSDLHIGRHPNRVGVPENLPPLRNWLLQRLRGVAPPQPNAGFVSTHDPDILDAVAAFAWDDPHAPADWDVVLISGDVVASGNMSDIHEAEQFLDTRAVRAYRN